MTKIEKIEALGREAAQMMLYAVDHDHIETADTMDGDWTWLADRLGLTLDRYTAACACDALTAEEQMAFRTGYASVIQPVIDAR